VWVECRDFIYKNSVRTSQETHYVSATETNRLMLFGETVAVCCENHMEHTSTLCGKSAEFLDVKAGGTYSYHCTSSGAGTVQSEATKLQVVWPRNRVSISLRDKNLCLPQCPDRPHPQPPIERVSGALTPKVKCPMRETDHFPQYSVEVMNVWSYTFTPPYILVV
jgi:hypothetical protein